ncbi:MAG: hypothetical protein P0S93_04860 [Candidatus Neptunochlamydia sp.]|nr:hypothetical protein [Candidatus Neptunochlamydia sp.]
MIRALLDVGANWTVINSFGEIPMDTLRKTDPEAHEFLKSTACVYLL